MNKLTAIVALAVVVGVFSSPTSAQDAANSDMQLPEACQQASGAQAGMAGMDHNAMMESMQKSMSGNIGESTKGYMQAMMSMHQPMMQGAMAADPDVAFNCSMIAHHKGAIAMSKVQLQFGKDEESKKMAQKTIDNQTKEVEEMTKWVMEHAKK